MTPSELKYHVESTGSHFFTRQNMRFAGDTMRNFGCRDGGLVTTCLGESVDCWELYRRRGVKCGLRGSFYFCKQTFRRVHPKIEVTL